MNSASAATNNTLLDLNSYPDHYQQATEFGDMDALGHINNLAIAKYYENARARFQFKLFGKSIYNDDSALKILIVDSHLNYTAECHFPETLIVASSIGKIGRSSYSCVQGLFKNNKRIGFCESKLVCTRGGQSMALTQSQIQTLKSFNISG